MSGLRGTGRQAEQTHAVGAGWPGEIVTCDLSCLVLSINLIHCGNEFRNSVPGPDWHADWLTTHMPVSDARIQKAAALRGRGSEERQRGRCLLSVLLAFK